MKKNHCTEQPAVPEYPLGAVVSYTDRHGRYQEGEVGRIEASWSWRCGNPPRIIYTLGHPTYAGRRYYATSEDIRRLISAPEGR